MIHAMGGEQDMRKMGGLQAQDAVDLPDVPASAALAIAGIPPLAGFFSKDEILAAAGAGGQWRAVGGSASSPRA